MSLSMYLVAAISGIVSVITFLLVIRLFEARSARLAQAGLEERMTTFVTREALETKPKGKSGGLLYQLFSPLEKTSFGQRLKSDLIKAGYEIEFSKYVAFLFGLALMAFVLGLLIFNSFLFALIAGVIGFYAPIFRLRRQGTRLVDRFNKQLPEALMLISGGLKAGYSLSQCFETVAKELPAPAGQEFKRVIQETSVGVIAERALQNLNQRVPSKDMELVTLGIATLKEAGGDMAAMLDKTVAIIRARARLEKEIDNLTAQGKLSGTVVALLPVGFALFIVATDPRYLLPLITTRIGIISLIIAIVLEGVGYFLVRRISRIRV